jgi:hypothetical protein
MPETSLTQFQLFPEAAYNLVQNNVTAQQYDIFNKILMFRIYSTLKKKGGG